MIITTKNVSDATVITHGGIFHADDVLSMVILEKIYGKVVVFRTNNVPQKLRTNVIYCDIGFGKYDHHQRGGNGMRINGVPYSSVGLLWRDFGYQIVKGTCNPKAVWNEVDIELIQGVDAVDNGKMPFLDYPAQPMSFSQIISEFNPSWDSMEDPDACFIRAVEMARIIFDNFLTRTILKFKAEKIVENAIAHSKEHIMCLEQFVPWRDVILTSKNEKASDIQFVVYPSNRGGYNWQGVPKRMGIKALRKEVPRNWWGLSKAELRKVTQVPSATFCHPTGFIGGAETFDDAIAMAKLAINA